MSMGWAEAERQEHQQQMLENDLKVGHKPGCKISYPPPDGGYCDCGLYERGVSQYDPLYLHDKIGLVDNEDWDTGYFWGFLSGFCAFLILFGILAWIGVL